LTRSFASRFWLRCAQPFLAKLKWKINWSLSPQGLISKIPRKEGSFHIFRGHVGASKAINDLLLFWLLPYDARRSRFYDGSRQVFCQNRKAGTAQITVSKTFAPSSVFSQQFQNGTLARASVAGLSVVGMKAPSFATMLE